MGLHINMRLSYIDMQPHYETGVKDLVPLSASRNLQGSLNYLAHVVVGFQHGGRSYRAGSLCGGGGGAA